VSGARSGLGRLRRLFLDPEPPLAALEVGSRALGLVRLSRNGAGLRLAAAAQLELPEGALSISMTEPNLVDPAAFGRTLAALVERAGVLGGARVGLVLPDPVARVALLPAAEARGRTASETEELVRFRLRKAVPFEIRQAKVAHQTVGAGPEAQVLAVAVLNAVLEQYEAACRAAGLEPGLVELAGLAIASAVEESRPPADRVVINWDAEYVSIVLARAGAPALFRTLTGAAAAPDQVVREVANTVLYYRERLGGAGLADAVVRCSALPPEDAATLLAEGLGLTPSVLDPWGHSPGVEAGLPAQAVAGAASCVLGRTR
jgi:hypothetical protein